MSRSTRTAGFGPVWVTSISVGLVAILTAVLGHTAIAEVLGGGVIILVAFSLGHPLTRLVAVESDPGRELVWNLLLVLVIVLALVGVGVMAASVGWLRVPTRINRARTKYGASLDGWVLPATFRRTCAS